MNNATISTSRTRATTGHLIDYRPLPAAWGDRDALRAVRAARARDARFSLLDRGHSGAEPLPARG